MEVHPLSRISVIVPVYQAEATLAQCIDALLRQDTPRDDYEILIVDNNSRDRSAEIASSYSRVRLLREPKQGAYAARNRALAEAHGEVIAFTDPDCVPADDWLSRLTSPLDDDQIQIVIGHPRLLTHSTALASLDDYERARDERVFCSEDPLVYYGRNNNMAVRRELFRELGPYVERQRGADVLLVRRCVDHHSTKAVVFASDAEVLHLEIDALVTYYRKAFTYGRSVALTGTAVPLRGLDPQSRWRVFRETCRAGSYPFHRSVMLFALLATASLCWGLGGFVARLTPRESSEARPA